jgi:four helix bundle protein
MAEFRFQKLEIWQIAIEIAGILFDIADNLEGRKLYRFADQLRGAGMSMSNNIAEGSGSSFKKVFNRYLDDARNSAFENANIVILLHRRKLIAEKEMEDILEQLDKFCRKTTSFQKSLNR